MLRYRRLVVTVLTAVALLAVIVLAAGLSALDVAPISSGPAAQQTRPEETPSADGAAVEVRPETLTERGTLPMLVIALVLVGVLFFLLLAAEGRKMLVYVVMGLLFLAAMLLLREPLARGGKARATAAAESEGPTPVAATSMEVPFEPAPWLILAASLGAGFVVVGAAAFAGARLAQRRRNAHRSGPLPQLAEEARRALAGLRAGQDLHDTVVHCYQEMVRVLQEQRDVRREPAMTPQEFARGLAAANLPQSDVWRITRLFERVRYGQHPADAGEEAEARACLEAVVRACEGAAP